MKYEEVIDIVRNTKNYGNPEGEYDFNGIVHIMLAALDNLSRGHKSGSGLHYLQIDI